MSKSTSLFINECCVVHPDKVIDQYLLYQHYCAWHCSTIREKPLSKLAFTRQIEQLTNAKYLPMSNKLRLNKRFQGITIK